MTTESKKQIARNDVLSFFEDFFNDPFEEFDLVLRPRRSLSRFDRRFNSIACDLKETPSHYIISADVPGMKKEDIKVEINNNALTISGEVKNEREEKDEYHHIVERRFGSFKRTVRLPDNIEEKGISADYKDGVLNVKIPKCKKSESVMIEIK